MPKEFEGHNVPALCSEDTIILIQDKGTLCQAIGNRSYFAVSA